MRYCPVQTNQRPTREKLAQRVWQFARPVVFASSPWFARKWRVAWLRLAAAWYKMGGGISGRCSPARTVRVDYPWNLSIGEQSSLGDHAWIYCLDKITIGKNCCIGEDVRLLTGSHDVSSPTFDLVTKPITIGDSVWVATGAIILPGVTVGEGAVVGAGAVVTKDVAPWTVVGGNPAREIGRRELRNDVTPFLGVAAHDKRWKMQ